jgi:predicted helicase
MPTLELKTNSKIVREYFTSLDQLSLLKAGHEGAVRGAFGSLLQHCARQFQWTLVNEYEVKRPKRASLRVDGAILDPWSLTHGYWEAKDEQDDLAVEAKKKIQLGYPTDNIIFQSPERAILYQNGKHVLDEPLKEASALVDVVKAFFNYEPPHYTEWETAVSEFSDRVPQFGKALLELIEKERKKNPVFIQSFAKFAQVCRSAMDPQLSDTAVEKMLVQHILTERLFRKVFDNPDFVRRNIIASEIEQVIDALTGRAWNREKFLGGLDRFYVAIEKTAASIEEFSDKQHFLNSVYENFFQGFDEKTADTHGIVYTPQPIVRFMVRSVDEILQREFGRSLGDKNVHILDPFVGTGNFILNVMRHIPRTQIPHKYAHELHANEVMLLPYYIASMNIEHEYAELTGEYKPFEGLCLVDTFELAESGQGTFALFTEKNSERVQRQKQAPITVVIGNPPYNAWQTDENDRNKNRKYPTIDKRVAETYAKDSNATLVNSLSDPYVKAFRWAADRIGDEGVLAYVSNNSYVSNLAFDGMRKHLAKDFDAIYVLDLGGNVRKNPKLSGTTHNVFGIQVGVAIGLFVRRKGTAGKRKAEVFYAKAGEDWRKEQKYEFLDTAGVASKIAWDRLQPDERTNWLTEGLRGEFATYVAMVSDEGMGTTPGEAIFKQHTNGVMTNNDAYVYGFDRDTVVKSAKTIVQEYNLQLARLQAGGMEVEALEVDESKMKWVRKTRHFLARGEKAQFDAARVVPAAYRPFVSEFYFMDRMFSEELYRTPTFFSGSRHLALALTDRGSEKPFLCVAVDRVPDRHFVGAGAQTQVFPLAAYDVDGTNRRDNITDWALAEFRKHYSAIFHYVYGLLHSSEYRTRYEANLKRELPRIPFAPDFWAFSKAGERLAELHIGYEQQQEWPLKRVETPGKALDWRVEKMKLSKDKISLVYNGFLTLTGIPPEAFEYRLGNRSALEWIVDQYQVSTDKRSGIVNDPNRLDDPEYIVRLIGQVITVSIETVRIVKSLPALAVPEAMSQLAEIVGKIVGIGKEPGRWEVRLQTEAPDARTLVCEATEALVAEAQKLRKEPVRAMLLQGESPRLLWLRPASAPPRDEVDVKKHLFEKWGTLLERLAK